jgi:hypothetical protein
LPGGNPGKASEALRCDFVHLAVGVPANAGQGALVLAAGSASWEGERDGLPDVGNGVLPCDVLMKWRHAGREVGIDRIWLSPAGAAAGGGFTVSGLQLTTGKDAGSGAMTPGVLATQRSKPTCDRVDGNTVAGMLVRAERGFRDLLPALRAAFPAALGPAVPLRLGTLHIFTNKYSLEEAAAQFRAANLAHAERFQLAPAIAAALADSPPAPRASAPRASAPRASFDWAAHGGMGWIEGCVPAEVYRYL